MSDPLGPGQEATAEEFKAMAHPLRLRILRLCLHEALTNKQIADRLHADPATTLHHVRLLLSTGFLAEDAVRSGSRGALEKPYRATGKSWVLRVSRPEDQATGGLAVLDALRGELADTEPGDVLEYARLGVKLNEASLAELQERIQALVVELSERADDPDGDAYGFFVTFHRHR
ncbi:MAG TPA: helix-turn-helix domain-containing protein [Acidimicrobiales bacterium]|nr:helix-turn-helix domain-containing protein [Acidimicrobiales bacterium]